MLGRMLSTKWCFVFSLNGPYATSIICIVKAKKAGEGHDADKVDEAKSPNVESERALHYYTTKAQNPKFLHPQSLDPKPQTLSPQSQHHTLNRSPHIVSGR